MHEVREDALSFIAILAPSKYQGKPAQAPGKWLQTCSSCRVSLSGVLKLRAIETDARVVYAAMGASWEYSPSAMNRPSIGETVKRVGINASVEAIGISSSLLARDSSRS